MTCSHVYLQHHPLQRIEIDPDEPVAGPAPPPDDGTAIPYESNELYAVPADVDPDEYYAQLAAAQEPEPVQPHSRQASQQPPAGLGATDAALIEAALRTAEGSGRKAVKLADMKLVEVGWAARAVVLSDNRRLHADVTRAADADECSRACRG